MRSALAFLNRRDNSTAVVGAVDDASAAGGGTGGTEEFPDILRSFSSTLYMSVIVSPG